MIIRKSALQGSNSGSSSTSVNSPFTGSITPGALSSSVSPSPSTIKKQRLVDVESPVTNIGTRIPGSGTPWIGPITPANLGGRVPVQGSIATLIPPQRYLQEEKKQAEAQGLIYNYVFNPTPDEGSGIPATSPPSIIPLTSTISPEAAQKIPYNLIIIGVIGLAGIYLLKKGKK